MNKKFKQNILDNKFVYLLIFTEVILTYIACSGTLYMSMNIVNKAILSFGLLLIYLSNYLLLLNNKNKLIIRNALTVAAFTILTIIDIIYFDMSDKYFYELFSAQLLMVFFMEDAVISLLSKNLFFNESIKIYFFIAWLIASILTYFKIVSGIKLLIILMPIVYSYPLIFFIINLKKIKKYNYTQVDKVFIIGVTNMIFYYFAKYFAFETNADFYIFFVCVEFVLIFNIIKSVFSSYSLVEKMKRISTNRNYILYLVTSLLILVLVKSSIMDKIFVIFNYLLLMSVIDIAIHFNIFQYSDKCVGCMKNSSLFISHIEKLKYDSILEDKYRKKLSKIIHDEILQDIIALKMDLTGRKSEMENDRLILITDNIIRNLRGKIDYFDPKIHPERPLYTTYCEILDNISHRYDDKEMLVEFNCDKDIILNKPYDKLVYRILQELVNNAYKHSSGYLIEITLRVGYREIFITIANYGDDIYDINKVKKGHYGLNGLIEEIESYGGKYTFECKLDNEDENTVVTEIVIPINKEIEYESFID